jgi:hypothetical protein
VRELHLNLRPSSCQGDGAVLREAPVLTCPLRSMIEVESTSSFHEWCGMNIAVVKIDPTGEKLKYGETGDVVTKGRQAEYVIKPQ